MSNEALAVSEATTLFELEGVIERGLATFIEVGEALAEIRDRRLYRSSHAAFEDYCRDRWQLSRKRAYDHISAAEVVGQLSPMGDTPTPQSERVARELSPLKQEPEALRDTWAEVVEIHGEQPTAANVREVVTERQQHEAETEPPQSPVAPVPVFPPGRSMGVHYSSESEDWATPQDLFDQLNEEFNFGLDVCALDSSAKCARYFTPENDGLAHDWRGTCWMNPPYGDEIPKWIRKAYESSLRGATVVCLVPARVDTGWWWDYCRYGEVRFLRGRLKFGNAPSAAPFPSAVVVFGRGTSVEWWER